MANASAPFMDQDQMDELLDGLDCRLRVSGMVADSIMMGIVNSAMEEAFQNACSKEGSIERLNEKSRFCELAVMQLEWCLKFVQEETDSYVVVLESCREREKLISDLKETRDRIQRRLEETEFAISKKDRELAERFEIELKLRQALEMKDRELRSLLEGGRTKGEGVQEPVISSRVGVEESIDGDFCELKNSVDQQFLNIKQKLEDERVKNVTSALRKITQGSSNAGNSELDSKTLEDEESYNDHKKENGFYGDECIKPLNHSLKPEVNVGFNKMGSDIDVLKETLDLAFGMMDNAISLSEVRPMEHQWRWTVERDTVSLVFKGFLKDIEDNNEANVRKGKKHASVVLFENWSDLMDEIASLRLELENLMDQVKTFSGPVSPRSQKEVGVKSMGARGKPPLDSSALESCEKSENISLNSVEVDSEEERTKEDQVRTFSRPVSPQSWKDIGGNVFSQKVKGSRGKPPIDSSSGSSAIESHEKSENISNFFVKVDSEEERTKEDHVKTFSRPVSPQSWKDVGGRVVSQKVKGSRGKPPLDASLGSPALERYEKPDNISSKIIELDSEEERRKDDPTGQGSSVADIIRSHESIIRQKSAERSWLKGEFLRDKGYSTSKKEPDTLKKRIQDIILRLDNVIQRNTKIEGYYDVDKCVYDDGSVNTNWTEEIQRLKQEREHSNLDNAILDEIYATLFRSLINEHQLVLDSYIAESIIMEDVSKVFLKERVKECNEDIENCVIETHFHEEIYHMVFSLVMEDTHNFTLTEQVNKSVEKFETLEVLIREDVCLVLVREMVREWNEGIRHNHSFESYSIENHIREEVYNNAFQEFMKDFNCTNDLISEEHPSNKSISYSQENLYVDKLAEKFKGITGEDVCSVLLRHMVNESDKSPENYKIKIHVGKEIYQTLFDEFIKHMDSAVRLTYVKWQEAKQFREALPFAKKLFQCLESLIMGDVCNVFFREMVKEWKKEIETYNIESWISEEINHIVIREAVKDTNKCLTKHQEDMTHSHFPKDIPSTNKLCTTHELYDQDKLIHKLNSLSKYFELEEDLMIGAIYELINRNMHINLVSLGHEKLDQSMHRNMAVVQRDESLVSVSEKLEKALQQIVFSKSKLRELASSLGIEGGHLDEANDFMFPMEANVQDMEYPCLKEVDGKVQLGQLRSMFTSFVEFIKATADFDSMLQEKIVHNVSRLEEVTHHLEPSITLVTSLRKNESLYRKAFYRRCQDLQKAEAEVDLLGDEVDALVALLGRIYAVLEYHSPVLQQYVGIMEILRLVRDELDAPASCKSVSNYKKDCMSL